MQNRYNCVMIVIEVAINDHATSDKNVFELRTCPTLDF